MCRELSSSGGIKFVQLLELFGEHNVIMSNTTPYCFIFFYGLRKLKLAEI